MNTDFISIVGTQIMGTLHPWLSFVIRYGKGRATLLHTSRTREVAERLLEAGLERGLGEIDLVPISMGLAGSPDCAADTARRLAAEAAANNRRVCFNLDGGLNYMIGDCALAIADYEPIFIQSSRWRCMAYDSKSGEFAKTRLPDPLPVREILDLQGVPYALLESNPDECGEESFSGICAAHKIGLPKNYLKNVEIEGIAFDLVWNPGNNRLRFLKDWRHDMSPDERLRRERDFAHWSTDRNRSGQLYDKEVFALVRDGKSRERLEEESRGQITVAKIWNGLEAQKNLETWFKLRAKGGKDERMSAPAHSKAMLKDRTLVVCMGTNLVSTLLAVCSHKPDHLVLCHVTGDPVVRKHVQQFAELAPELGLASFEAVPFEIDGVFPEQVLPQVPKGQDIDVDVSISAGAKGQGAMLALWAKSHGFGVWSLHNGKRQCVPLHNPRGKAPIPFDLCDPHLYFRLQGETLLDCSLDEKGLEADIPAMDALLAFMREAIATGNDEGILRYPVKIGQSVLHRPDASAWELRRDGRTYTYRIKGGQWFEKLCAVALLRAGASHVRVNSAMRWNADNEKNSILKHFPDSIPHRLELDVVGVFEGDLLLVSCKSYFKPPMSGVTMQDLEELASTETRDTGSALGRFGLRILAHMNCPKACTRNGGRVLMVGWRELCRPEELRRQIDVLRKLQQSTN